MDNGKSKTEAKKDFNHNFFVPDAARWENLISVTNGVGGTIDSICKIMEKHNEQLKEVMTHTKFADPKKYPDNTLADLISHFNSLSLQNSDLEKEDIFGDAYEYLLEKFADETKKKGGEFFTPREVVNMLVNIVSPKAGMKICDPTCGSGGMLIMSRKYVADHGGNIRNLVLDGQESNYGNLTMCKMNLVLHDIVNFKIVRGNTLSTPLLVENGKLKTYDIVLANFPFSMKWDNSGAATDPYNRYRFGVPPEKGKADFAFIQHMYAQLNERGKAAIVCSQGVLFRGGEEKKIRKGLVEEDAIEAIIAIPEKLFFGTGIPACVMILNKKKSKNRKGKIIFIYGANDYEKDSNRNILRKSDITKVVNSFDHFKDVDKYCHVANLDEIKENEYNLNVPRYVDISIPEEKINIKDAHKDVINAYMVQGKAKKLVDEDLKELYKGFEI